MVGAEVDVCPNCSHPFPAETQTLDKVEDQPSEKQVTRTVAPMSRPFKFILLFLLSFIVVLAFINAEGMKLNGSTNSSYLFGDIVFVSFAALLLAVAFMFIDYMVSDRAQ